MKIILKSFVKKLVTSGTPYKRNGQSAPAFLMNGLKDFTAENKRLVDYINKTQH